MNKELRELYVKLEAAQKQARELTTKEDVTVEDLNAATEEIRALKAKIVALEEIDEEPEGGEAVKTKDDIDVKRAFMNAVLGRASQSELKLLNEAETDTGLIKDGTAGDEAYGGYIVPPEYDARIREFMREYKSVQPLIGYHKTNVTAGTMIYEDISSLAPLADMVEFTKIEEQRPKFQQKTYAIRDYGALLPISNTLLQDEQGNLFDYIARWFARKDVRTRNIKVFGALKTAKAADIEEIETWEEIKEHLNITLDPMIAGNSVIITNQTGFNYLDNVLDGTGKPIMQPDVIDPTVRRFCGKVIHVFADGELANDTGKAPFIFGAMAEAAKFVDRGVFEMASSKEYGFGYNATYIRCIDRFTVMPIDTAAYVYALLTLPSDD